MSARSTSAAAIRALAVIILFSCTLVGADSVRADTLGWPQPGGPGSPVAITYSFSNLFDEEWPVLLSEAEIRASAVEAFSLWALYAPLNFIERPDSGPAPSDWQYAPDAYPAIRIGFHPIGDQFTLAHAFLPWDTSESGLAGDIHFNAMTTFAWSVGSGFPAIDFLEVITHEIGHSLGLGHTLYADAIMEPFHAYRFRGLGTGFLLAPDILAVRALYGTGVGSVQPMPEPSTVLLVVSGLLAAGVFRRRRRTPGR